MRHDLMEAVASAEADSPHCEADIHVLDDEEGDRITRSRACLPVAALRPEVTTSHSNSICFR